MSFAPLLAAPPVIQVHAFAAMAALALGVVQFSLPKGTFRHRTMGFMWVALMVVVALSSFWIHDIRLWGPWSPIHLLSIYTLVMLPIAVWHAHRHRVDHHKWTMFWIFMGGLVIAGIFTFVPGRIMHDVLFGS